ncbi:MAG: hypothetical protein R2857_03840 [Vampirovibrionales bacterium]
MPSPGVAFDARRPIETGNHARQPLFARTIIADTGASQPSKGSLKLAIYDQHGQLEFQDKMTVAPEGFTSGADFVQQMGQRMAETIERLALDTSKDPVDHVVVFGPGPASNNTFATLINLLRKDGDYLRQVRFKPLWKALGQHAVQSETQRQLRAVNDMFGSGTSLIEALRQHRRYKKFLSQDGFSGRLIMTGGGCGVIDFTVNTFGDKPNVLLTGMEGGHLTIRDKTGRDVPVELNKASSTALIRNFAASMKLPGEAVNKLVHLGDARVVTDHPIMVKASDAKLEEFRQTGLFEEGAKQRGKIPFTLKTVKSEKDLQLHAFRAIDEYFDGVGQVAANMAIGGGNAVFVGGPLVNAIKAFINHHHNEANAYFVGMGQELGDLGEATLFDDILRLHMLDRMDTAAQGIAKATKFKIVSDIQLSDNTEGGLAFADSVATSQPNKYRLLLNA